MLYCCNNIIFKSLDSVFKFELYSFPVCGHEDENRQMSREKEWMVSLWVKQQRETKTVFLCLTLLLLCSGVKWLKPLICPSVLLCSLQPDGINALMTLWHTRDLFPAHPWGFVALIEEHVLRDMILCRVVHMLDQGPRDKKAPELKTFSIFCARVAAVT